MRAAQTDRTKVTTGMTIRPTRTRMINALGLLIGAASLAVMTSRLAPDWPEAAVALRSVSPGAAFALFLSIAVAEVSFALIWVTNTRRLGGQLSYSKGVAAYFYSGLSRFLPGAIVPYVARTALASASGTSAVKAGVATGLETILSSMAALTLALVGLSGRLVEYDRLNQVSLIVTVALIATASMIAYRLLPRFLRRIGRGDESSHIPPTVVATSFVSYGAGWLLMGWGVAALLGDLTASAVGPVDSAGALALAWFAGFVAVPVPGGLGVREAVIAGVLAGEVGLQTGILLAFIHRVAWWLVISIGGALAGAANYMSATRTRRNDLQ